MQIAFFQNFILLRLSYKVIKDNTYFQKILSFSKIEPFLYKTIDYIFQFVYNVP